MSLERRARLGHYEIVELIGKGGMGEVYRARDSKLGRDVAIKILPPDFARDQERVERFEREARLLAQLNHSNVAAVYGYEVFESQRVLVMELVEGETLADRIGRGPLPIEEVVPLFIQVAEGLEAAHEKGIVHRDLKPANIKIAPDGKPKVLDFGLATVRVLDGSSSDLAESPTVTKGTAAGVVLGTAHYMSPEQSMGKPIDKRTDVWAFGCCLYEALTGKKVFPGATLPEVFAAILDREPELSLLPRGVPLELRRLVARCLNKNPWLRLRDVGDARIVLSDVGGEPAADVSPPKPASSMIPWAVAAGASAIAVAAFVAKAPDERSSPDPVKRFTLSLPDGDPLDPSQSSAAISPDGGRVVYVASQGESTRLLARAMGELEFRPIAGTEGATTPVFSPDGQWVAFRADDGLKKVSVAGGASVALADVEAMWGASWGDDDHIVFNSGFGRGLSRVSSSGGAVETLTKPDFVGGEAVHAYPDVLPGSRRIVFNILPQTVTDPSGYVVAEYDRDTEQRRVLFTGGSSPRYVAPGYLVFLTSSGLSGRSYDPERGEVGDDVVDLLSSLVVYAGNGSAPLSASKEGSLLFAPGEVLKEEYEFLWLDRQGRIQSQAADRRFLSPLATLSPTGNEMALEVWEGSTTDIWTYDLARGTLSRLTFEGNNLNPVYSPDGAWIAFASDRTGKWNLYRARSDASGSAEPLLEDDAAPGPFRMMPVRSPTDWSSDGRFLLYVAWNEDRKYDVRRIDLGTRETWPLLDSRFSESQAVLSPGLEWMAYVSDDSGEDEIYIRSFPDLMRKRQISSGGGELPRWSPRGDELLYRSGNRLMTVRVRAGGDDIELGAPQLLFERDRERMWWSYDQTPDGERFLVPAHTDMPSVRELQLVLHWSTELAERLPLARER